MGEQLFLLQTLVLIANNLHKRVVYGNKEGRVECFRLVLRVRELSLQKI